MRPAFVIAAFVLPVIALALPDDATLSRLWLEHGTVIATTLNIGLMALGSWIRRTKETTRAENGGLNTGN
jgi:hypothetical protein